MGKSADQTAPARGDPTWVAPAGYGMSETCAGVIGHRWDTPRDEQEFADATDDHQFIQPLVVSVMDRVGAYTVHLNMQEYLWDGVKRAYLSMAELQGLPRPPAPGATALVPGTFDGVTVVVDRMSAPYLSGATIDFVDTIEKQGFTIDNPNATGSCACGDSFH